MTATLNTAQDRLAIDGGTPVRNQPWPWELPGAHWIGQEEIDLVTRVLKAKSPFRYYGIDPQHMVDQLEDAFRKRLSRKHALGTGSATAALYLALSSVGIGPGDEVLIPGFLWVSCIGAVVRLGAIPRLVDIDNTFCMDPKDLKKKIGPQSKAVLLVHMSGAIGRVNEVLEIVRAAKLPLIEDAAQANGATFHGTQAGTFGDVSIFSFQANKNMTSGEGGMLVCDRDDLYNRAFALHDLGYARNSAGRLDTSDTQNQVWGIGSRMSELTGAFALAQLGKLDRIVSAMRKSKWEIRKQLADIPGLAFRDILDPAGDSGPFLVTIYKTPEICRRFTRALQAEGIRGHEGSGVCITAAEFGLHWYFNNSSLVNRHGVTPGGWPWTDPANAFAANYQYGPGELANADDLSSRAAMLAIPSCLSDADVSDAVKAFKKVARSGILS